jgi:quercetin dioxygenase-like cupin family protein
VGILPIDQFFFAAGQNPDIHRPRQQPGGTMTSKDHGMVVSAASVPKNPVEAGSRTSIQMLIPPDRAPHFAMRCFTIEAGGGMPNHTNSVEHEQYILAGRAEIGIGERLHTVNQGDVVYIPAGVPHWYRVLGEQSFQFLCLIPNQPDRIELVGKR